MLGDAGEGGEDRQGVRTAHHVEVVDQLPVLAQPQALGQEEEVELGVLRRAGEVDEGLHRHLAAGAGIGPDGVVVHAGEVGGEDDLLGLRGHGRSRSVWSGSGAIWSGLMRRRTGSTGGRGRGEHGVCLRRRPRGTTPALQRRHQPSVMPVRSWGSEPGRRRYPSRPWPLHSMSRSASSSGGPAKMSGVRPEGRPLSSSRRARRSWAVARSVSRNTTTSPKMRSGSPAGPRRPRPGGPRPPSTAVCSTSWGVMNTTSVPFAASWYGTVRVRQRRHEGLTLGRPGHDRRTLDAEEPAVEVDVVQAAAVDEPARGDVLHDGIVLPRVPQHPHDLDGVGGLVEQLADVRGRVKGRRGWPPRTAAPRGAPTSAASSARTDTCALQPARPLLAWSSVETALATWNGSVCVVTIVGTRPMLVVSGRQKRRQQHGVQATPHLIGAVVGDERLGRLHRERVLDREEVDQAPLGLAGEVGPVAGLEQLRGPGVRCPPRRAVPPGAVERHRQVQRGAGAGRGRGRRHHASPRVRACRNISSSARESRPLLSGFSGRRPGYGPAPSVTSGGTHVTTCQRRLPAAPVRRGWPSPRRCATSAPSPKSSATSRSGRRTTSSPRRTSSPPTRTTRSTSTGSRPRRRCWSRSWRCRSSPVPRRS